MKPRTKSNNTNNNSMTNCHKGGIKIKDSGTGNAANPFDNVNPFQHEERSVPIVYNTTSYDKLDLNIDNYSRNELFLLFGLKTMSLTEDIMKECKKNEIPVISITVEELTDEWNRLDKEIF